MRNLLLVISLSLVTISLSVAQTQGRVNLLWYNTENLFDSFDDSLTIDEEFTPTGGRHWTWRKMEKKLDGVYKVIVASFGFELPLIVGLCEVENRFVLNRLVYETPLSKFEYRVLHCESPDARGIDVALLYRSRRLWLKQSRFIRSYQPGGHRSRDILYAKFLLDNTDTLHIFLNHWPSKYGGELETEGARAFAATWLTERSVLKANVIMGEEHTDISWNGVPSYALDTNRRYNPSGLYYTEDGTLHRYNNETDNYWLNHYQLLYSVKIGDRFLLNIAGHLTPGRGYYEEYKDGALLSKYGIPYQLVGGAFVEKSDLIRQKWLNNQFYGGTYSFSYKSDGAEIIIGGGANRYDGDHFGKIKWVEKNQNIPYNYEWYKNKGIKDDFNSFLKATIDLPFGFTCFADMCNISGHND